jgi:hypothetical protein
LEILILKEMKVRFQMNNIYYSLKIRMSLLLPIKLFRQLEIIGIWGDTATLSTRNGFKFCEIQYHEGFWKIKYLLLIISITCVPSEIVSLSISAISINKHSSVDIWHQRLGHLNHESVKKLNPLIKGMDLKDSDLQ